MFRKRARDAMAVGTVRIREGMVLTFRRFCAGPLSAVYGNRVEVRSKSRAAWVTAPAFLYAYGAS